MSHVLIVEDDPRLRRTLTISLTARRYQVTEAPPRPPPSPPWTPTRPTSSCSTSACPTGTASTSWRTCAPAPGRP